MRVGVIGVMCKWFFQATGVFRVPAKCLVAPSPSGGLAELNGLRKPGRVSQASRGGSVCQAQRPGKAQAFPVGIIGAVTGCVTQPSS